MSGGPGQKREFEDPDGGPPRAKRSRVEEAVEETVAALQRNPAVTTLALQVVPPAVAALAAAEAAPAAEAAGAGAAAPAAEAAGAGAAAPAAAAPGFLTRATNTIYRYRGTVATAFIAAAGVGLAASGSDFGALDAALAQGVTIVSAGTATLMEGLFASLDPVAAITTAGSAVANSAVAGAVVQSAADLQTAAVCGALFYGASQAADAAGVPLGPNAAVDAGAAAAVGVGTVASGAFRGFTAFSRGTGTLLRRGFMGLGGGLKSILTSAVARASGAGSAGAGAAAGSAAGSAGAGAPAPGDIESIIADMEDRCNYSARVSEILIDALRELEESLNTIYRNPTPSHLEAMQASLTDIITRTERRINDTGGAENLRNIYKQSVILFLRKAAAVLVKRAQMDANIAPSAPPAPTPFNSPAGVMASPSSVDNERDYRSLILRGVIVDDEHGFVGSVEIFLRRPRPDEEGGGGGGAAAGAGAAPTFGGCPTCGSNGGGGRTRSRRRKSKAKKSRKHARKSYRRGHKKRSRSRAPTKSRSPSEAIYASPPVPATTTLPHMESSGPPVRS